jgi:glycerol-3-phosphate dehydrogenase (NAD(P)+)
LAVVGTGAWGVTLAIHAAAGGTPVALLARTEAEAAHLRAAGVSPRLPGRPFAPSLAITAHPPEALDGTPVVLLVVPAQTMRANIRALSAFLSPGATLVSASKGLEVGTALRMSQVIAEEAPAIPVQHIAALSGPNLAREIAAGKPSSTVVACPDAAGARRVQAFLMAPQMRVYTHNDVVGVELGGALKNVVALGAGMCDGLEAGDNAKAALMTRGLAEIARLGKAAGAQPLTFAGLAGLGDLIATCVSPLSRNRSVGVQLARGRRLEDVQREMRQVAEGVPTTVAALQLARQHGVEMPITELMHRVLFEGLSPQAAGAALMQRDPKHELAGFVQ